MPISSMVVRSTVFLLPMLVLASLPASADYIEPGSVTVETEEYRPARTEFSRGVYEYSVSWQGLPVASANVVVDDRTLGDEPLLRVEASAKTAKVIDLLYKLRFTSESIFQAQTLQPIQFVSHQKENSRVKLREVSFSRDGQIQTVYKKDGEEKERSTFKSANATFDPISAAFVARSLPIELGSKHRFDIFNGKHRYLITFTVKAREQVEVRGKRYDSFRVVPSVEKLTDTDGEKRLDYATIWISADESREVLKLESKVAVGNVSAQLVRFTPLPDGPATPKPVELVNASSQINRF